MAQQQGSVNLTVSIPQLDKLHRDFMAGSTKAAEAIAIALKKSAISVQREARLDAPHGVTGQLQNSVQVDIGADKAVIWPNKNYAIDVHQGTRPHAVPFSQIEPWARKKGIPAGAVWQSIKQKGTKANPFMKKALEGSRTAIYGYFLEAADSIKRSL